MVVNYAYPQRLTASIEVPLCRNKIQMMFISIHSAWISRYPDGYRHAKLQTGVPHQQYPALNNGYQPSLKPDSLLCLEKTP